MGFFLQLVGRTYEMVFLFFFFTRRYLLLHYCNISAIDGPAAVH